MDEIEEIQKLCEERGLPFKGRYLSSISQDEFNAGCIKFNIPDVEHLDSCNGEGVY